MRKSKHKIHVLIRFPSEPSPVLARYSMYKHPFHVVLQSCWILGNHLSGGGFLSACGEGRNMVSCRSEVVRVYRGRGVLGLLRDIRVILNHSPSTIANRFLRLLKKYVMSEEFHFHRLSQHVVDLLW